MPRITTGFWGGNKVLFGIHKGRAASMSILLEDHHLKSVSDAMLATNTLKKRLITLAKFLIFYNLGMKKNWHFVRSQFEIELNLNQKC